MLLTPLHEEAKTVLHYSLINFNNNAQILQN